MDCVSNANSQGIEPHRSTPATGGLNLQRRRLLDAMAHVVGEQGFTAASVSAVCARAKLSRPVFYKHFANREECFLAVLDDAYEQAIRIIIRAFVASADWRQGLREALASLLVLFESHPGLARVWMIEAIAAGPWAFTHRERRVVALAETISAYWQPATGVEPAAAMNVMAAVIGTIQRHLATDAPEPLITLLGPLIGIATNPFLDPDAVAAEIRQAEEISSAIAAGTRQPAGHIVEEDMEVPRRLLDPRAHRARACIMYLASVPDASNRQIADAIGVPSAAQASGLLSRLVNWSLVEKRPAGPGRPNANSLTAKGEAVARALVSEFGGPTPYTCG